MNDVAFVENVWIDFTNRPPPFKDDLTKDSIIVVLPFSLIRFWRRMQLFN